MDRRNPGDVIGAMDGVLLREAAAMRRLVARAAVQSDPADSVRDALSAMSDVPDGPPGTDEAFMRAIDEGRPHRPLFAAQLARDEATGGADRDARG